MDGYDGPTMGQQHPLDEGLRERLRKSGVNITEMADAIGVHQSWLHKFSTGAGHASIDDAIRIMAYLLGSRAAGLTDAERRLLTAWRKIPAEEHQDAVEFFENHARFLRRGRRKESAAPVAQTSEPRARKGRGIR